MDVVALGELLIDFTVGGPPTEAWRNIRGSAGGAPANVLATVCRLGGKARFIGKVGQDDFGDFLEASLRDVGIDTCGLLRGPEATTLAFVRLDAEGERCFTFARSPGADTQISAQEVDATWLSEAQVFHFGSLSMTQSPSREATLEAIRLAKTLGCVVSFDPNLRPLLWTSMGEAKAWIWEGIRQADLVKVSFEELRFLTATDDVAVGLARLREENQTAVLLVTMGPTGAAYQVGDVTGTVSSIAVDVVDTTAAGDAFFGAFLYGLTRLAVREALVDAARVSELVRFANVAGALTTTRLGAFTSLPTLAEINRHS